MFKRTFKLFLDIWEGKIFIRSASLLFVIKFTAEALCEQDVKSLMVKAHDILLAGWFCGLLKHLKQSVNKVTALSVSAQLQTGISQNTKHKSLFAERK